MEGHSRIWLSYRGAVILVSPEQCRAASQEEKASNDLVKRELEKQREELEGLKNQARYFDLRVDMSTEFVDEGGLMADLPENSVAAQQEGQSAVRVGDLDEQGHHHYVSEQGDLQEPEAQPSPTRYSADREPVTPVLA